MSELGVTNKIAMKIELKDKDAEIQSNPYRLRAKDSHDLDQLIEEKRKAGIIVDTNSEIVSPAFIVRKRDGTPRMVIDYRKLNKETKMLPYPIPNFDDMLERLTNARLFILLDLAWGYLQMPIEDKASREKTAFITETQTGEFTRAMFGLANAPRYFAKLMDKVLGTVRKKGIAFHFFDDICIYAETWKQLLKNSEEVLVLLLQAGLTLRLKKCTFGMESVEYLGYILGYGELRPGERKVLAIKEFPKPCNKHDVRRFVGLASFFRRFVPKFAQIAQPLTELTKGEVEFEWKEQQDKAFNELKEKLCSQPVLKLYNPNAFRTELHTDASSIGLAGILLRKDKGDEPLRLVYAISRCTSETEQKYHSSRLELMAIAWALERLRPLIIGIKFYVITDCQSLVHMNAWKTKNAQIARWMSQISEYDLEVIHKSGERMQHVDALSRAPVEGCLSTTIMSIDTKEDEVLIFQRSDPHILNIVSILNKKECDRDKNEKAPSKHNIVGDPVAQYRQCWQSDGIGKPVLRQCTQDSSSPVTFFRHLTVDMPALVSNHSFTAGHAALYHNRAAITLPMSTAVSLVFQWLGIGNPGRLSRDIRCIYVHKHITDRNSE